MLKEVGHIVHIAMTIFYTAQVRQLILWSRNFVHKGKHEGAFGVATIVLYLALTAGYIDEYNEIISHWDKHSYAVVQILLVYNLP